MSKWKRLLLINLSLGFFLAIAIPSIQIHSLFVSAQTRSLDAKSISVLDNRVTSIMESLHIPGMAVAIVRDGVVEIKGYGVKDNETKQPIEPNTAFVIGSNTKPFTAMATMMLVEEGKVDLDESIDKYLTNLPPQWVTLTLRQLLSHTSGISEDGYWDERKSPQEFFNVVKSELDFPPGESWMYSNSGFFLTALIIEQVSGQPYGEFLRDRIFTPLGMKQTQAKLEVVPNLATGYEGNQRLDKINSSRNSMSYGSGNIISTASDMAKWVQALDRGELLSAASYQQLWTATKLKNGRSIRYGLGWYVGSFNGHSYTEHGGNGYGYSSGLIRYPKDRFDAIVLNNNVEVDGLKVARAIASVYEPSVDLFSLSPQPDPNPEFTQRFLSLLQGNDESLPLSPEFQLQLNTNRSREVWQEQTQIFRKVEKLEFLHQEASNGDRTYYYKTFLNGKPTYIAITMTAKQQVAGYGAANPL
jgi:D-alanyl-D-alanine carboxypeptidase